jgi:DNA-binding NarL/FixJ family response regulator
MISIGIIEDNQDLRKSLEEFIETDKELQLVFSFNSFEKWLIYSVKNTYTLPPFIFFLDLGLPGISGLKAISIIKHKYPNTHLVIISGDTTHDSIWQAISNGADGYLLKPFSLSQIKQQIEIVKSGGAILSPLIATRLIKKINNKQASLLCEGGQALTRREKDVLEQLLKGMTYKEVSNTLNISITTVNDHIKNIYLKMGVNSKAELIALMFSRK